MLNEIDAYFYPHFRLARLKKVQSPSANSAVSRGFRIPCFTVGTSRHFENFASSGDVRVRRRRITPDPASPNKASPKAKNIPFVVGVDTSSITPAMRRATKGTSLKANLADRSSNRTTAHPPMRLSPDHYPFGWLNGFSPPLWPFLMNG
jgi:hypothetical protein